MPKLTILICHYRDFHRCWFTIQALRMYQKLYEVEIVVVDNHPDDHWSKKLEKYCIKWDGRGNIGVRYIPLESPVGVAAARNLGFKEARAEWVLCIDSHVMLYLGAIALFLQWLSPNVGCMDLITGPNVSDKLVPQSEITTHRNLVWRGGDWGTWGKAFKREDGLIFSPMTDPKDKSICRFVHLSPECTEVEDMPPVPSKEVDRWVRSSHCTQLGLRPTDDFEIPAHGLGLFACRKDAFQGFNEDFRGVGGSDTYYYLKHQAAGYKARSIGLLPWVHQYEESPQETYRKTPFGVARNFVLGINELVSLRVSPKIASLDNCRNHYILDLNMKASTWDSLILDPVNAYYDEPKKPIPDDGPGHELKRTLESIDIEQKPDCPCRGLMVQMDVWGLAKCRLEHNRSRLIKQMKTHAPRWGWMDKLKAAALAVKQGMILNPLDPIPDLYDIACNRWEEKLNRGEVKEGVQKKPENPIRVPISQGAYYTNLDYISETNSGGIGGGTMPEAE